MLDLKLPTHRRGFLGSVAAGAATLGLSGLVRPLALAGESVQGPAKEDPALTAWLGRIKGKHRQVYDMPEVNGGVGVPPAPLFFMNQNKTGVPGNDITNLAALRDKTPPLPLPATALE